MKKHYVVLCVGSVAFLFALFLMVDLPEFSGKGSEIDVYILLRQQSIFTGMRFLAAYAVFAVLVLGHGVHSALSCRKDDIEQQD